VRRPALRAVHVAPALSSKKKTDEVVPEPSAPAMSFAQTSQGVLQMPLDRNSEDLQANSAASAALVRIARKRLVLGCLSLVTAV
jgi:hypothetical protein